MNTNKKYKVIIFCAPSGAGKTTIIKHLMTTLPQLSFSVSATSRPMRKGEQEGVNYFFVPLEIFRQKVDADEFVEWEEVYPDQFYGTLHSEVEKLVARGKVPVFDVDVKGAMNLKKFYSDRALVVFIKVPLTTIKERLIARNTETESSLVARLARAEEEMDYESEADKVIENIDLQKAVGEAIEAVQEFTGLGN